MRLSRAWTGCVLPDLHGQVLSMSDIYHLWLKWLSRGRILADNATLPVL